jgi:NAD(P)-dependent dehydrogenase (short-subunit alcohol dehydrogenase family)
VFSSVWERGRKPVVLYGAAKAGLTRYLEGLDHRYRGEGLKVVTVKPGFVKTGMTDAAVRSEPDEVAARVLAGTSGHARGLRPRLGAHHGHDSRDASLRHAAGRVLVRAACRIARPCRTCSR